MIGVERVRAASLGSVVFRNRVPPDYERKSLELPELESLTLSDGGAIAESLESHLVSKEETPPDSFVGDTIVRLQEPRHIDDNDARSPIVVGHVVVGNAGSELFIEYLVTVGHLTGRWQILSLGDTMTVISQDRKAPCRQKIVLDDVTDQSAQKLKVYAPHTAISPRTWLWSEPPVGPNMLAERPAFPTRAPRILAREMASAIGATDCWELEDDADVQRIAANTIDAYIAETVVSRTHAWLLHVYKSPTVSRRESSARLRSPRYSTRRRHRRCS